MPCKTVHATLAALALAAGLAAPCRAQGSIAVTGLDGATVNVAIGGLTRHLVNARQGGEDVSFEGVLVGDILAKAGVPMGEKLHGSEALSRVVLARGRDGYTVAFGLAELDGGVSDAAVLVADRRNGRKLDEKAGPLQLVAPFERRAVRWVRQVERLDVREVK